MSGQTRRRLSKDTWHQVLRRFEAAGSTVEDFCAGEGVCVSSFYRWRSRLESASNRALAEPARRPASRVAPPERPGFIDLGDLGTTAQAQPLARSLELRLDLGAGIVLHVVRH